MSIYQLPADAPETRARRVCDIVTELRALPADKSFAVTIKPETRSMRQNRYWHGVVVKAVHDHARDHHGLEHGHDVWHAYLRDRFLPADQHRVGKSTVVMRASTATLSRAIFADLIERVAAWAATELGCEIPPPDSDVAGERRAA